jgi:ferric-dicitrate binding protein FerR (iron transport regulator)
LKKYFSERANPEEETELAKLVAEADAEILASALTDAWQDLAEPDPVISPQRAKIILQQIIEENEEPVPEPVLPLVRKRRWLNYAAVAVMIFLASGVYFFSNTNRQEIVAVNKVVVNDLPPGQTGAILTLANGNRILLDSAGTGLLATQGDMQVINNKGQLSYQSQQSANKTVMFNTMSTPKGRQYQLLLSDGSRVWLNAASSITYPAEFSGNERSVSITGEAYFEITADKTKPFKVNIDGKGEVEVLGTRFNINAYRDEPTVNTTLLEGSVTIKQAVAKHPRDQQATRSAVLRPGQQAQLGSTLHVINDVNTEEVTAWKNGYFFFSDASTEVIMRQVKRWYDAEIQYEGTVKDERFAGSVPRSVNASKLLEVLELTKTVKFTIEDKKIIVKPY